jgi:hypothetical protein
MSAVSVQLVPSQSSVTVEIVVVYPPNIIPAVCVPPLPGSCLAEFISLTSVQFVPS